MKKRGSENAIANIEFRMLANWLQPAHLEIENLVGYKRAFDQEKLSLVCIRDFLINQHTINLYHFMIGSAQYRKMYGLFSDCPTSEEKWHAADEEDRFYRYSRINNTTNEDELDISYFLYLKTLHLFEEAEFIKYLSYICGLPITRIKGNAYGHAYYKDDFLKPHSDVDDDQHLAFILYVNPNWKAQYGGALHFIDSRGKETVLDYSFNDLIIFDVNKHKYHYISDITEFATHEPRLSIGGWYK